MTGDSDRQRWFTALYQQHYGAVVAYAVRRVGQGVARDVAAEVFLTGWRRVDQQEVIDLPWLYRTARFVVANHARSERRLGRAMAALAALEHGRRRVDVGAEVTLRRALVEALDRLSDADRELLLLMTWENLTPAEAARVLGCTAATARVRLHRARRRLKAITVDDERPAVPGMEATGLKGGTTHE